MSRSTLNHKINKLLHLNKQTLHRSAPKILICVWYLWHFYSTIGNVIYKKGRISIHARTGYVEISNIIVASLHVLLLRHLFCNLLNTMLVVGGTSAGLVHSHNVTFSYYLHVTAVISFFWFQLHWILLNILFVYLAYMFRAVFAARAGFHCPVNVGIVLPQSLRILIV